MQLDIYPDKSFYYPGQTVCLLVELMGNDLEEVVLLTTITYLSKTIIELRDTFQVVDSSSTIAELTWSPPLDVPRGYGVDLRVQDMEGQIIARASTAFDVLEVWTQAPRYGFLTDFSPERSNIEYTAVWLTKFHLNGLQFYDWMYRHDQLLPPTDPFVDLLNRRLSLTTTKVLIEVAHARNIAAMPYTAIYGASIPFQQMHPEWSLFDENGNPIEFAGFLMIMNPAPASPWSQHLLVQFEQVLEKTAFDGIHIDQYGDPKNGRNFDGNLVELKEVFPRFINATKALVDRKRGENGTVIFNAVANWPIETVAPTDQDAVYIEVWPPNTHYQHLHQHIVAAQQMGQGKPVILAVYTDPTNEHNARLVDVAIFASGGFHIELGEPGAMLADPYFPKHGQMSSDLVTSIRHYYDFAVRYENVLSQGTKDTTPTRAGQVKIDDINTDPIAIGDKVWVITRKGQRFETISLINLLGIASPTWNGPQIPKPTLQSDLRLRYYTQQPVKNIWWATPDGNDPTGQTLSFKRGEDDSGKYIEFNIPSLAYWDLIVLE